MATDFSINRIADLGRTARRMLIARAVLWTVATNLTLVLGLIFVDYQLQVEGWISRLLMSLVWIVGAAGLVFCFLRPPLQTRFDDTTIAQWIERRFPFFQDRLSSAVQFIQCSPSDRVVGDPELRNVVVQEANALCRRVEVEKLFDSRGLWCAVSGALVTLLLLGLATAANPSLMGAGFLRLLVPWMRTPWPTEYQLVFQEVPSQVVMGTDLTVSVEDRHGKLPPRVVLLVGRSAEGSRDRDVVRREMQRNGAAAEATLFNVTESLRIRAVGGDDTQMPWQQIDVIDAPRLEQLELVITPPRYTGNEATQANGHFQALVGSQIELRGRSNRRLQTADLRVDAGSASLKVIPLSIDEDRLAVSLGPQARSRWTIEASGEYFFQLTDEQSVLGDQPRWTITAIQDEPPDISQQQPQRDTIAGRNSVLAVNGTVTDDFGIRSLQLHYLTSAVDARESVIPLFSPPDVTKRELRYEIAHRWDLATVDELQPGTSLTFFLAAEDFAGQREESAVHTVRIVSDEELLSWFVEREQEVRQLLIDAHARQSLALTAITELAGLDVNTNSHVDGANQVRSLQREVRERISLADEAILARMQKLLVRYDENRLAATLMRRRLETTIEQLRHIDAQWLINLQYELDTFTDVAEFPERTRNCQRLQQNVLDGIQEILGGMQSAAVANERIQELARILQSQRLVRRQTAQLRRRSLSQINDDPSPQLRAGLEELSKNQRKLARSAEVLFSTAAQTRADTRQMTADFGWAAHLAKQHRISTKMRESSEDILANRLGLAHQLQDEVVDRLSEIQSQLFSERVAADSTRGALQLNRWIARQTALIDRTGAAYTESLQSRQQLASEQAVLANDVERGVGFSLQMVMTWAAGECVREMREASDELRRAGMSTDVNRLQLGALSRLRQMKQAMDARPESSPGSRPPHSSSNRDASEANDSSRANQLQLLWILQQDLNRRILEIQQHNSAPASETWQELAREQGELANLLTRIMSAPDDVEPLDDPGRERRSAGRR